MMLGYEFKKLLGNRPVVISLLVLLIINAAVCYFQTKPKSGELPSSTLAEFFEMYMSNEAEMQNDYLQMRKFMSEQQHIWSEQMVLGNREYEMQAWENKYAPDGYRDAQLFNRVISIKEYAQSYPSKIDTAVRTAYEQIINSSANGADPNMYTYKYQAEVIRLYQNVKANVKLEPEYVRGWNEYFGYDFMPVFYLSAWLFAHV